MSGTAVERIVVQAAPQEKSVMLKAKKLGLCFPPLRRTHPIGYALTIGGAKRWQFTDEFKREAIRFASQPGGRAGPDSIDDVLAFVEASNKRIATMEAKASGIIKKPIWCV